MRRLNAQKYALTLVDDVEPESFDSWLEFVVFGFIREAKRLAPISPFAAHVLLVSGFEGFCDGLIMCFVDEILKNTKEVDSKISQVVSKYFKAKKLSLKEKISLVVFILRKLTKDLDSCDEEFVEILKEAEDVFNVLREERNYLHPKRNLLHMCQHRIMCKRDIIVEINDELREGRELEKRIEYVEEFIGCSGDIIANWVCRKCEENKESR